MCQCVSGRVLFIFIYFGYFHSASSVPVGPTQRRSRHSTDTASEFHAEAPQSIASEGLNQGPYVAARAGFKPTTFQTKGGEYTNEPPHPTKYSTLTYVSVLYLRQIRLTITCQPSRPFYQPCLHYQSFFISRRDGQSSNLYSACQRSAAGFHAIT